MNIRMTPEQMEAYLRSLPEGPAGDVVIDRNPSVNGSSAYTMQATSAADPALLELYRRREELEEEISDLEMEEPMEVDFDSYDLYESMYSEWEEQMDEMREKMEEYDREINMRI